MNEQFSDFIAEAQTTLGTLANLETTLDQGIRIILEALENGKKLLVCGNGGSASEAQHLVTELVGRFRSNRQPLTALFLGGDASQITCIGNDFSWDDIFARPLQGLGQPGDVLICFSTSGMSSNVVAVLKTAQEMGIPSIAFLGKGGGVAGPLATLSVVVNSDSTARIQEGHLFMLHWLCEHLEEKFPQGI
ncbi:D-sedoheptulose-7-phosphate isomerase [Phyllobacterium myrsinacearum]|uniref:D-sedoheptulose 7-phosphate isomerase n=1 Tax=Phyllobacterium myrsinacearum TaxID=28101 RepID=A0A839EQ45_9HYPH|nr:SIS domain-containing protein [Phyllobacterium myrsinacearum]MBA8879624.1 D-sedoheptulose 7-phosphate isomerase [Phyllobacterium myrsinacearum]